ncbi:MAG: hypothetical protein K8S54_03735 [Spirochaetia bacterium]|nr:hypothetical protein [Spirochaetia bacterium]
MKQIIFLVLFSFPIGILRSESSGNIEAANNPDKYAWDIFMELNVPADMEKGRGVASTKALGTPGITVWESWKLARNVFTSNGCKPTSWENWDDEQSKDPTKLRRGLDPTKAKLALGRPTGTPAHILIDASNPLGNETRMNKAAFDFIVQNDLFTIDGQEKFHKENKPIDLPVAAREVKGAWRLLTPVEAGSKRYHMATIGDKVYGLTGLHIITKDLPQWFWSTFEHVDNPLPETNGILYFDRHTRGGTRLPGSVANTKWQYYRLRGTQTDFTDLAGRGTLLSNTQIEQGFQASSSCVSCHAHATIGPKTSDKANRLPIFPRQTIVFLDPGKPEQSEMGLQIFGWTGRPDPNDFYDVATGRRKYTQTDFMWSFFRAARKSSACSK